MSSVAWAAFAVNLVVSIAVIAAVMATTFFIAIRRKVHATVDIAWSLGFAIVAAVSYVLSIGDGDPTLRAVALVLPVLWAARLSTYLWWRARGRGEDPRYAWLLSRATGSVKRFAWKRIYLPQGCVMWIVSIPIQLAMYIGSGTNVITWVGVIVWAIGISFEAVGDAQLARFKRNPLHQGHVLDTGLWAWTRHPNYFGDACLWWGIWLVACSSWVGLLTVFSPILMTHLLVNRTGKALLEKSMRTSKGAEFDAYVARTSGFFPRPPRQPAGAPVPPAD